MMATHRHIEEASLNAWPALRQTLYDGWLLRYANGYTKRANSVNVLYPGSLGLEEKLRYAGQFYHSQGLPTIFRLTPLAPSALDETLANLGYPKIDPTDVMTRRLDDASSLATPRVGFNDVAVVEASIDDWLDAFCHCQRSALEHHQTHRCMLRAILATSFFLYLKVGDEPVACGFGVVDGEYLGLFDFITHSNFRRRGLAGRLLHALCMAGRRAGAQRAYLQVVHANEGARSVYQRAGFQDTYQYWYRVSP
ncbi:MAG: GNAT family N-acetyltransferase [Pseudomonadota bacterium]